MRLSVVVPTFNRPDALPRALQALDRQTLDPDAFELVLVEDVNNDARPAVGVRRYQVQQLKGTWPGASSARNVGWRAAQAPVVLFIGDDILASPSMLERHLALHDANPGDDVGVLGHVSWARELRRTAFMTWLDQGVQFDFATIQGTEAGPGHFYTSNVSLKRSALEATGGFDEQTFPFLYEDIDLGMRLFERGFRLIYEPEAHAEHLHEPRLEDWKRRMGLIARAERAWVERHPDQSPYFHDRFQQALALDPRRGRAGVALLHRVPRSTPLIGERIFQNADVYFRQQLGRAFMDAWRSPA